MIAYLLVHSCHTLVHTHTHTLKFTGSRQAPPPAGPHGAANGNSVQGKGNGLQGEEVHAGTFEVM